jgi:hypothetical protein
LVSVKAVPYWKTTELPSSLSEISGVIGIPSVSVNKSDGKRASCQVKGLRRRNVSRCFP